MKKAEDNAPLLPLIPDDTCAEVSRAIDDMRADLDAHRRRTVRGIDSERLQREIEIAGDTRKTRVRAAARAWFLWSGAVAGWTALMISLWLVVVR